MPTRFTPAWKSSKVSLPAQTEGGWLAGGTPWTSPRKKVFAVDGDASVVLEFTEHLRTDRELDAAAPQYGQEVTLT